MMPALMLSWRPARSSRREGVEDVDVGEDGERVVEAADEVFAGGEVDAGLAADGGVDLGEEGGGDLDVADAAHVDGGEEAGEVADDSAAEGEEERSGRRRRGELLGEAFDLSEALVALAGGEEEDGGLAIFGKGGEEVLAPESPDLGRGDDEGTGRAAEALRRGRAGKKIAADEDGVLGGNRSDLKSGHRQRSGNRVQRTGETAVPHERSIVDNHR